MNKKYATTNHGHGLRAGERERHALSIRLGSKADEKKDEITSTEETEARNEDARMGIG